MCKSVCNAAFTSLCGRAILLSHFLLASGTFALAQPIPFAIYGRFVPISPTDMQVFGEEGPFPEYGVPVFPYDPLPGDNENGIFIREAAPNLPPPSIDMATLIATMPAEARNTFTARDDQGNELGRLVFDQVAEDRIDLNAANATVNEADGTIQVQFDGSLQEQPGVFSLDEATGIYASEIIITDIGVGYAGGHFLLPLDDDPNTSLQENILTAFQTGQIIGFDVVGVWTGAYMPEPSAGLMLAIGALLLAGWRSRRWC